MASSRIELLTELRSHLIRPYGCNTADWIGWMRWIVALLGRGKVWSTLHRWNPVILLCCKIIFFRISSEESLSVLSLLQVLCPTLKYISTSVTQSNLIHLFCSVTLFFWKMEGFQVTIQNNAFSSDIYGPFGFYEEPLQHYLCKLLYWDSG